MEPRQIRTSTAKIRASTVKLLNVRNVAYKEVSPGTAPIFPASYATLRALRLAPRAAAVVQGRRASPPYPSSPSSPTPRSLFAARATRKAARRNPTSIVTTLHCARWPPHREAPAIISARPWRCSTCRFGFRSNSSQEPCRRLLRRSNADDLRLDL